MISLDDGEDLLHQQRRQAHRGLVHQDHLRARHQRAADRQHLLLAAGEIAGQSRALLQAREISEDHVDVGIDLVVAAGEGAEPQILDRRHVGDDAAAFHHLENAAADDLVGIDAVDALAVEHDVAAGDFAILGLEQAGDRLQRGRLAGAVGPQQRDDRALGHFEAEAPQHQDDVVIDHLDVVHGEQRGGRGGRSGADGFDGLGHAVSPSRRHHPRRRVIQYSRDASA